ncbi:hypothetical protein DCAR_0519450 [Daucus carota subsp. sativus]|uniref:Uncharacterized protein n=1 Tax=Daucus carota subsp. sativus TaxID=79200 RepID=A0A164XYX6_DAUCS|nr:hypothetical protein DCAR_0519450 [Daucus carota subsp. sativus]
MLPLFLTVAFSAVPLTLYLPPIRNLCLFLVSVDDLFRQTGVYSLHRLRFGHRLRIAFSRFLSRFPR